jgi:tRNA-modifying protein YgfZ
VSEAAAEILRVESGRPRFGAEMSEATIPAEAGIDERAVSFTKGCYIGQETVARLHYKGKPNRHLRGLRLDAPASSGEAIGLGDREVGKVGTACVSPALGPIALAIVRREAEPGARVTVGGSGAEAEVVELPFS